MPNSAGPDPLKWRLLASMLPPANIPILDCGCGDGGLTSFLARKGREVRGIEFDAERAAAARGRGLDVRQADIESADFWKITEGPFGAVIFSDVLEHLQDPERALRGASSILRPGGGILVSLPNVAFIGVRKSLFAGRWEYGDEGILDRTHRWFFTHRAMLELVRSSGLAVVEERPLPTSPPTMPGWYQAWWTRAARVRPTLFAIGFLWWLKPAPPGKA